MKTGYTAGAATASSPTAERDGRRLISVVLGASERSLLRRGRPARPRVRRRSSGEPFVTAGQDLGDGRRPRRERPRRGRRGARGPGPVAVAGRRTSHRRSTRRGVPTRARGSVGTAEGDARRGRPSGRCPWWSPTSRRRRPLGDGPWWASAAGPPSVAGAVAVRPRRSADRPGRRAGLLGSRPMSEVASVLYGREDIRRRVRGARPRHHRGLRGAGTRPHLGPQGRRDVPRGPDARDRLPVEVHFMAISRYGDAEESLGRVQILLDLDDGPGRSRRHARRGHRGHRAHALVPPLGARARGPGLGRGLRAAGQGGPADRAARVRYAGLRCPDRFVVGYGLDFAERYRNLPDILAVEDLKALRPTPTCSPRCCRWRPTAP